VSIINYFFSLQIARQILEAHASMLSLNVADAKLQYIRNWQALQDFGITYFVVKVGRNKKEVSSNNTVNMAQFSTGCLTTLVSEEPNDCYIV
jgi:hypothetical protein